MSPSLSLTPMDRDLLIIEHRPHAMTIARRMANQDLSFDDLMSIADEALIRAVDEHIRYPHAANLTVSSAMRVQKEIKREFGRLRKREKRIPTVSFTGSGLDDGEGFFSLRDLRCSLSLNPHAEINPSMAGAIARVRESAFAQCETDTPRHFRYMIQAAGNRQRVAVIQSNAAKKRVRDCRRAEQMKDAA